MEPLDDSAGKMSENSFLFRTVNEEFSLQSNPQFLEEEEDEDAWMRDDAISLEDEDEKPEALPFGLNQSWPRVSRSSHRPRLQPKKKLLRQISQESLDESINLLLGHIVILPDAPQDLVVEPSLPTFIQHPVVEEEDEELHGETLEENVNVCEEMRIPILQEKLEEDNSLLESVVEVSASDQVSEVSGDQVSGVSGDQVSEVSGDQVSGAYLEEEKIILPDLESIEKDCCNSGDSQQQISTDPVQSKVGQDATNEEQLMGKHSEAKKDDEIKESKTDVVNQALENLTHDSDLQVKSSDDDLEMKSGVENETKDLLNDLKLHGPQAVSKEDVPKDYLEQNKEIDVPLETTEDFENRHKQMETDVITNPETSVRKKSSPGARKRPPLLRYLSQESIEESTNLLMDHVVMMDFQQKRDQMSPEGTDLHLRSPFLVDIKKSPLLDEVTIGKAENEEELFLYKGEVDSCDEEDDDDTEETLHNRSLLAIPEMTSNSFISDEAASTLKDIELIRVELDNAIHAFEILKEEFPERADDSLLPKALNVFLEDIEDEDNDECLEADDNSAFHVLPDEILIHIFKHFSHAELCNPIMLVCKKWNILAKDPSLWSYLDLSNKAGIPSDILETVFLRCTLLRSITFQGRYEVGIEEIQAIIDHCPNVPSLEFGFVRTMHDDLFNLLISGCRTLTSLNIEGCDGITDSLISKLILLPKLRCLNLSHCTKLTDGAIFEIARFCDHLEELNIDGIPWITDTAVTMLCDERQNMLTRLRLDGAELTDISTHHAMQCPNLQELGLSFCEQLTDYTLNMLKEWKKPVRLRLQKGKEFSEAALANLFICPQMSNLTHVDLSECSELRDPGLINIATRCPLLTNLAIEWCWFISDVGLVQVLDNCRHLEHLDLIGLHAILGHCLADIPTKLPQLEFLDLRQCNRITDAMLVQIVTMKHNLVIMNYYGEEVVYGNIPSTMDL